MKNKSVFVYSLSKRNFWFFKLISRFWNVFIYRLEGVSFEKTQSTSFKFVEDFTDHDQWIFDMDRAYEKTRTLFDNTLDKSSSNFYWQHVAISIEQTFFLETLVENTCKYQNLDRSNVFLYSNFFLNDVNQSLFLSKFKIFSWIELKFNSVFILISTLLKYLYSMRIRRNYFSGIIIDGISPVESGSDKNRLNFRWFENLDFLKEKNILYIVPGLLEKEIVSDEKRTIYFNNRYQLINFLSLYEKMKFFSCSIFHLFKTLFKTGHRNLLLDQSFIENRLWLSLIRDIDIELYLSSLSYAWPAPQFVESINIKGVPAHCWFYSSGEFFQSPAIRGFRDRNIRFMFPLYNKYYVWSDVVVDLLNKRPVSSFIKFEFVSVGPIVNGDINFLNYKKAQLYSAFKEISLDLKRFKKVISVFDISSLEKVSRLSHGQGPYTTPEHQEVFYREILKLAQFSKDTVFLIKRKRSAITGYYQPKALNQLLQLTYENVITVPFDIDPYLLIMVSDLVISSWITSPSMMALLIGKKGVYLDPEGYCKYTYNNFLSPFVVANAHEALSLPDKFQVPFSKEKWDYDSIIKGLASAMATEKSHHQ